ncbi:MAG TPA: hypothetical protein VMA98_04050 [Candidatus Acidoferrales bacterium]|nr:hypothetical protein [Candidatus Acidoferrales bacterium]
MSHEMDDIVALLAIFLIFGAPMAVWLFSRIASHTERMEMIRHGMVPPPAGFSGPMPPLGAQVPPPHWTSKRGVPPPGTYDDYYYAQRQLRKGISLSFIGLALLIGLGSIGPLAHIFYLGPWLLGGLIPMFVGIAQVVNAILNGAQFPAFGHPSGRTTFGPPPSAGGSPPPPQAPPGPYAWRPGSTPEIEKHDNAGS